MESTAVPWIVRKTFIELDEPNTTEIRCRALSDFPVDYSIGLQDWHKRMDDLEDKSSEKSTAVGSWADESEDEREEVISSLPCSDFHEMPVNNNNGLPMMPVLHFLPLFPPVRSLSTETPILPKPVKSQQSKFGEVRTTVMIRNMPNNYTRKMILDLLDVQGFAGKYDFVYLPIDFETKACLGYAFINLIDAVTAIQFWSVFDGFSCWSIPSRKVAGVSWSGPHQGLEAHIERYRNSSIMSESTPDEFKPIILQNGARLPFPLPTRKLRASRQFGRR